LDFNFTPDQELFKKTLREFAEAEIRPQMMQWDEEQVFPRATVEKMGELGLMGIIFPEKYGGAELTYIDYVLAVEEISRVDGSMGITIAAHNSLCTNAIFQSGSDEQKDRYLPSLCAGKMIGSWSLTEPSAGSDAGGTQTLARKNGDGYVLNGSKTFASQGSVCDVAVVYATVDRELGKKGITAFILEPGTPGFRVGHKENKLGLRASDTAELVMDDCQVPVSQRLGEEGHGFYDAMQILDGGRISIAALGLGIAQGAFDSALQYSKEREQFGQPISSFQAVQHMLADMAKEIEVARWLTYRAAWMKDQGQDVNRQSATAKLVAGETAVKVTNTALQIFGGYGFTKDYPAEKFFRDAKLCTIGEGTSEIMRLVIARALIKQGTGIFGVE
jgi:alkylation response protein AidB-like acyl-CoA dehydrogenase